MYELAARDLGTTADELAFDRAPEEYRCAALVEHRFAEDWARTIARHWLYETADAVRLEALKASDDAEVAGLAAKIDREEVYHRMHAEMWEERLRDEARFREAVEELWPQALTLLPGDQRDTLAQRLNLPSNKVLLSVRDERSEEFASLWEEMTVVRRSIPGAAW